MVDVAVDDAVLPEKIRRGSKYGFVSALVGRERGVFFSLHAAPVPVVVDVASARAAVSFSSALALLVTLLMLFVRLAAAADLLFSFSACASSNESRP